MSGAIGTDVERLDGRLQLKAAPSRSIDIAEVMRRNGVTEAEQSRERKNYALLAHGAQFTEVKVDHTGQIRVTRAIEVSACGKIISQEIGGIVWRIGMAL